MEQVFLAAKILGIGLIESITTLLSLVAIIALVVFLVRRMSRKK